MAKYSFSAAEATTGLLSIVWMPTVWIIHRAEAFSDATKTCSNEVVSNECGHGQNGTRAEQTGTRTRSFMH